jgi:uncharacterized protein (TIGR02145 family)
MKKHLLTILVACVTIQFATAQAPSQFKYQAVLRNGDGSIMASEAVSVDIQIVVSSPEGESVFYESHSVTTSPQGVINLTIGSVNTTGLAEIDWGADTYFIKVSVNGLEMGISQLLAVPYALHAKTADALTGELLETDPAFTAWDKSTGIEITESQISDLQTYLTEETDPTVTANFDFSDAAEGDLLQFNGTKWVKVTPDYISDYTVTETDVTAHQTALEITESQISDLQSYLTEESDPTVTTNFDFTGAANGDLLQFNGTQWVKVTPGYLTSYTETDPEFIAWDKSTGISVTENQISDLQNYLTTESDPTVTTNFDFTGAANGDLLQFNGTQWVKVTPGYLTSYTETDPEFIAWDKSTGISVTENQISDLQNYLTTESDPTVTTNFDFTGAANGDLLQFNGTQWVKVTPEYITSYTETDPEFLAWDKSTGISVTENQISDLQNYLTTESDPTVTTNFDFTGAANGDLLQFNGTQWVKVTPGYLTSYTETDPEFIAWDKSTGINVTESQISDLKAYLTSENDPAVSTNFDFTDAAVGDLLQFDGNKWIKVTPNYLTPASGWVLGGNSGTIDETNFIGTSDNVPLNFKVNNQKAGRIDANGVTSFGYQALNSNSGSGNTGIGYHALFNNTSSGSNTALGYRAMESNTGMGLNTAIGANSLRNNTTGEWNTAIGASALLSNTSGTMNTAIGGGALSSNINGGGNIAVGGGSLNYFTSGTNNTSIGFQCMLNATSGSDNTAMGYHTLLSNLAGSQATAIGSGAMQYSNNTSTPYINYNVAVGYEALRGSTSASVNTGNSNTAVGYQSMLSNTSGNANTALGVNALNLNTEGTFNTALGANALDRNTSGWYNSATGRNALFYNQTGDHNTANGANSLSNNIDGSYNTSFGSGAGFNNVSGSGNVFLGYFAGYNETGSNKLYIANSDANPPLIYGDFSTGKIGIGTSNPGGVLDIAGGFIRVQSSDVVPTGNVNALEMGFFTSGGYAFLQGYNRGTSTFLPIEFSGSTVGFRANGTTAMKISTAGNVGIGTDSPTVKLHVTGNAKFGATSSINIWEWDGVEKVGIDYNTSNGDFNMRNPVAGKRLLGTISSTGSWGIEHTSGIELVRVTGTGLMGIGTVNPGANLHVQSSSTSTDVNLANFFWNPDASGEYGYINIGKSEATDQCGHVGYIYNTNFGAGSLFLGIYGDAVGVGLNVIKGGNVGIGKTTPTTKLDVNGVITATDGNSNSWNTAYGWGNHSAENYLKTETDPIFINSEAANITAADIAKLGNLSGVNTGDQDLSGKVDKAVGKDLQTNGTQAGQMQYWNGTGWVTVEAGNEGQVLTFTGGVPTWKTEVGDNFVINFTTGKIWMDRNLGAAQVATSSTDPDSYGDLYQWGRAADGHQVRTSGTTTTLSSSDTPGHGNFILAPDSPVDWRSPQNDNLWQGVSGVNNPCPAGYRLPTEAELNAERASWSSNNSAGAFASPLKLPVAGYRGGSDGSLDVVGSDGYYWSSTVDGTYSRGLYFISSGAYMYSGYRAYGRTVRCIKE